MRQNGPSILLLEDDQNLGFIVSEHLQMNGFEVVRCPDGEEGFEQYSEGGFDLCLVDVMMPRMDGFTFARKVREIDDRTPIIFLTARSLKEDKIEGFKIGCDDYLTKPFSIEELLLRITAVLKRSSPLVDGSDSSRTKFTIGDFEFDSDTQTLTRKRVSRRLTPKESDLLRILCLNANSVVPRNEILQRIWGNDSYFSGRSMDVFVSRLRKYLKDDDRVQIMGLHGKGLRLIVP